MPENPFSSRSPSKYCSKTGCPNLSVSASCPSIMNLYLSAAASIRECCEKVFLFLPPQIYFKTFLPFKG